MLLFVEFFFVPTNLNRITYAFYVLFVPISNAVMHAMNYLSVHSLFVAILFFFLKKTK